MTGHAVMIYDIADESKIYLLTLKEYSVRLLPVELSAFTNSFNKKSRKNNLEEEKNKENQHDRHSRPNHKLKKSDIKNSSESNPLKRKLTGGNYLCFSL